MASLNNDIEKYLRGELSPAEMHALEQKALQDPFLADALEGAEHAAPEEFSVDLKLIKQSLSEKTKTRRRFIDINGWQWYSGIAAGLLLLAMSAYTVIMMIHQQRANKEIAQAEESVTNADSVHRQATPSEDEDLSAEDQKNEETIPDTKPLSKDPLPRSQEPQKARRNDLALNDRAKSRKAGDTEVPSGEVATLPAQPDIASETVEEPVTSEIAEAPVPELRDEVAKDDAAMKAEAKKRSSEQEDTNAARALQGKVAGVQIDKSAGYIGNETTIRGKVTDSNFNGLPGVNVVVKGTALGTVTGVNGEFEISVPAGSKALVFNFIGFVGQEVALSSDKQKSVDVTLAEDVSALSEVVVVGYGTRNSAPSYPTFEMATPQGGRKSFKQYLEENIQYPQQAREAKAEGKVTVQFTVLPDGTMTDFKIIRGIGSGCDEELIRAIQNGPRWTPSKKEGTAVADQVRVRYRFELP